MRTSHAGSLMALLQSRARCVLRYVTVVKALVANDLFLCPGTRRLPLCSRHCRCKGMAANGYGYRPTTSRTMSLTLLCNALYLTHLRRLREAIAIRSTSARKGMIVRLDFSWGVLRPPTRASALSGGPTLHAAVIPPPPGRRATLRSGVRHASNQHGTCRQCWSRRSSQLSWGGVRSRMAAMQCAVR